jgi:glycosyltransferase involved in cell wall biosynthesis
MFESGGIRWLPLTYHRFPTVPATLYDVGCGVVVGLAKARSFRLIHARSTVPALMAEFMAHLRRVPWVFDVRGLMAEEYADAGHWRRRGVPFRVTNWLERLLMRRAQGLVVLTEAMKEILANGAGQSKPLAVIPCAADPTVFRPSEKDRVAVRAHLGLGGERLLVYAGSIAGWNAFREMLSFFAVGRAEIPGLRLLVLTEQTEAAQRHAQQAGLARHVLVRRARPDEVPAFLAAADAGIAFRAGGLSKKAASPTKYGEYLASGLAVVTDGGTGDAARLRGQRGWIVVDAFDEAEYRRAARELALLVRDPHGARKAARALAAREFSLDTAIDRYDRLYRAVAAGSRP